MRVRSEGYSFDDDFNHATSFNGTNNEQPKHSSISIQAIVLIALGAFLIVVFGGYFFRRLARKCRESGIERRAVQQYKDIMEEEDHRRGQYRSPEDKRLLEKEMEEEIKSEAPLEELNQNKDEFIAQ